MTDLLSLGFDPFFSAQLDAWDDPALIPARVAAEHRGAYEVWTALGGGSALLSGRLHHELDDADRPTAGDWVALRSEPAPDAPALIERRFARRTVFTRGVAGTESRAQVVAANVDVIFAVTGLDGSFNLNRIQRYLARIYAGGARPVIVLNKADLCEDAASMQREVERRAPGVPVLAVSALAGEGLEAIRASIAPGATAAFLGSSGAGKSTLINALAGLATMSTGAVREGDAKGRHTTTHRQLVRLPGGGLVLDTPGMRELQLLDADGLDAVFPTVAALAASCRFADCGHDGEPGCAVQAAVASGALDEEALAHWRKLEREARANARRQDVRLRREEERAWGRRHAQAMKGRRPKRREAP